MTPLPTGLLAAARIPGLRTSTLQAGDATAYHHLVQRNQELLAAEYAYETARSLDDVLAYLRDPDDNNVRFGIRYHDALVGRVDLNPVDPPRYAIGYWLDRASGGRGLATAAVAQAVLFAEGPLGATGVYAGVTHGNERSIALLKRLGFTAVTTLDTHIRFHLPLDGGPPRDPHT